MEYPGISQQYQLLYRISRRQLYRFTVVFCYVFFDKVMYTTA